MSLSSLGLDSKRIPLRHSILRHFETLVVGFFCYLVRTLRTQTLEAIYFGQALAVILHPRRRLHIRGELIEHKGLIKGIEQRISPRLLLVCIENSRFLDVPEAIEIK